MTRSTLLGCVAGLLLALDGLEFVMSRTALLDIFVMFWVLAAFALPGDRPGPDRAPGTREAAAAAGERRMRRPAAGGALAAAGAPGCAWGWRARPNGTASGTCRRSSR